MELPNISLPDFGSLGSQIVGFFKTYAGGAWNAILGFVGGNPVAASVLIGLSLYLIVDFCYHTFIDKPMASFGQKLMNAMKNLLIFIIILAIIFVLRGAF